LTKQTTPPPGRETTPKRYTYGLVTEPRSIDTHSVLEATDNWKTESVNKYTFKLLPPTEPSFVAKPLPRTEQGQKL